MTKEILIVNSAEPGTKEFKEPIERIISSYGCLFTSVEYKECNDMQLEKYAGVILTGSPQGDDIVEHHAPFFEWIKTFEKPILGICAGHHICGFLYGSKLFRSLEPESGDFRIRIIRDDALFNGLENDFLVRQMHNDSISVPEKFDLIASSATCKNQVMKHRDKPLYTCQFHPEFYNHRLILNFIDICE